MKSLNPKVSKLLGSAGYTGSKSAMDTTHLSTPRVSTPDPFMRNRGGSVPVQALARGGKTGKHSGKTQVNIMVGHPGGNAGLGTPPPPPPAMPARPPIGGPPPGMPPGGPPGGPPGMPPGGPPMMPPGGGGPPGAAPPRPPVMKRGGRVPDMTGGAGGAKGRMEKIKAYGKKD